MPVSATREVDAGDPDRRLEEAASQVVAGEGRELGRVVADRASRERLEQLTHLIGRLVDRRDDDVLGRLARRLHDELAEVGLDDLDSRGLEALVQADLLGRHRLALDRHPAVAEDDLGDVGRRIGARGGPVDDGTRRLELLLERVEERREVGDRTRPGRLACRAERLEVDAAEPADAVVGRPLGEPGHVGAACADRRAPRPRATRSRSQRLGDDGREVDDPDACSGPARPGPRSASRTPGRRSPQRPPRRRRPRPACRRPSPSTRRGSAPRRCRRSRSSGRRAAAPAGSRPPRAASSAGRGAGARAACGTSRGRRPRLARPVRAAASPARRPGTARARTSAAATRSAASWSRSPWKRWRQWTRIIAAHDPAGTTTASASERARSVRRATLRASETNPLFHAGCPQQVAPEGRPQATPAAARIRSESRTAAGFSASPRQVGKRATTARHHTAMTVHVTSVALSYGADEVLSDVSAILRPRDRVALVGRNGAGKTTLLRILAGELDGGPGRDLDAAGDARRPPRPAPAARRGRDAGLVRRRRSREGGAARGRAARARGADGRAPHRRRPSPLRHRAARVRARRRLRVADAARGGGARPGVLAGRPRPAAAHVLGRRADARVARPGAGGGARRAAPRRAHQPPRHRRDRVARGPSGCAGRRGRVRVARPLVPRVGGDRRARDRPRRAAATRRAPTPTGAG